MDNQIVELSIDKEGNWYSSGVLMFRLEIVRLFSEHVSPLSKGGYEVLWDGQVYELKVEDVPFVIESIIAQGDNITVQLTDSRIVDFRPDALFIVNDIAYTSLFFHMDTRFSRKAQWQLNTFLSEENGEAILRLPTKNIPIKQ